MLGIILVFIIILVSLYYEFYDIIDRFVRNHPGFIMAVIILLLTLVLMLFIGLFIGIDQIDLPLTIVTEKNLDARITSKVDEAITRKGDEVIIRKVDEAIMRKVDEATTSKTITRKVDEAITSKTITRMVDKAIASMVDEACRKLYESTNQKVEDIRVRVKVNIIYMYACVFISFLVCACIGCFASGKK